MNIVWRDIFKPRYALLVETIRMPIIPQKETGVVPNSLGVAVPRLPFKRSLNLSFNEFYKRVGEMNPNGMVFAGSLRTFRGIYGIGSTNKGNMKNAIVIKPQQSCV